jgi:hypothetical protein
MNGYVMNTSTIWTHAMKRAIGPGAKVPLDELFEQYGAKHDLKEGQEFVQWLRNVKLKDSKKWKVVLEDESTEATEVKAEKEESVKPANRVEAGPSPLVQKKLDVADIVGLSVRKARETLPKVTDLKLLKYSLQEANQLAGKDSLCKIIRKRIKDLQIAR